MPPAEAAGPVRARAETVKKAGGAPLIPSPCHCLAIRQAARHMTQFYDRFLAVSGLRTTQSTAAPRIGSTILCVDVATRDKGRAGT